jgi:nitrous oxide reductase accessory protein NosL
MKTYVHLRQHLAEFMLVWEMFQTKLVGENQTHFISLYFSDRASWYQSICYNQLDAHMFYFVI